MEKKYYIAKGKKHLGAFSLTDLQTMNLSPDTLIWSEDLGQWTKANEITELKDFIRVIPPPTPSQIDFKKSKERTFSKIKKVFFVIIKSLKKTVFLYIALFIVIYIVLNIAFSANYDAGINLFGISMGIYLTYDQEFEFLYNASLFWSLVFSMLGFIFFYFKEQKKLNKDDSQLKRTHLGLAITFWILFLWFAIHFLLVFIPLEESNGTLDFPHLFGGLLLPVTVLSIIWAIKRKKEKKLNQEKLKSEL